MVGVKGGEARVTIQWDGAGSTILKIDRELRSTGKEAQVHVCIIPFHLPWLASLPPCTLPCMTGPLHSRPCTPNPATLTEPPHGPTLAMQLAAAIQLTVASPLTTVRAGTGRSFGILNVVHSTAHLSTAQFAGGYLRMFAALPSVPHPFTKRRAGCP